jgi:F-type H+-transporting ATPase subunit beta
VLDTSQHLPLTSLRLEERITATQDGGMVSVQAIYVPADDYSDPAITHAFWHIDSAMVSVSRCGRGGPVSCR